MLLDFSDEPPGPVPHRREIFAAGAAGHTSCETYPSILAHVEPRVDRIVNAPGDGLLHERR